MGSPEMGVERRYGFVGDEVEILRRGGGEEKDRVQLHGDESVEEGLEKIGCNLSFQKRWTACLVLMGHSLRVY